jgi:hypothetical protein
VKRDEFNENLLFESIRENRLEIKNPYLGYQKEIKTVSIEFVMMRKDVVDKILDSYELEKYDNGKYIYYKFSDLVKEIDILMEIAQEYVSNKETILHKLGYFGAEAVYGALKQRDCFLTNWIRWWDSYEFRSFVPIWDTFIKFVNNGELDEAKEFAIEAVRGCIISHFMERTRRSWIPQCGEGSQDSELKAQKLIAQTVIDLVEEEEKEMDDW